MKSLLMTAALLLTTSTIANAQANFTTSDIRVGGNSGNETTVTVTVANTGTETASTWVDVFYDRASAPSMGEYGDNYRRITLGPGESQDLTFIVPDEFVEWRWDTWVDVIVDTDNQVAETVEWDNFDWKLVWLYYFY